jgi:hypothetical protein
MEGDSSALLNKKVLSFLREIGGKRLEFDLDEASSKLSIQRKDLEKALFSLQREGYLRIIKIPPSDTVLEEIKNELRELDGLFLADEISSEEYLRKWREKTEITDIKMSPMPSIDIKVILSGLSNLLEYLEKLNEVDASDSARKKLMEEYNDEIVPLAENLGRLLEASMSYLSTVKGKLNELCDKLELIKIDSKVRGIDRRDDLKILMKEADSIMKRVSSLMKKLDTGSAGEVDAKKLEEEKIKLEEEREVIKAKLLVEGESAELKTRILSIDKRIADIRAELETEKVKKDNIDEIQEKMSSLHKRGLLKGEIYEDIRRSLDIINKLRKALAELGDVEKKVTLNDVERLRSILKVLEEVLANR